MDSKKLVSTDRNQYFKTPRGAAYSCCIQSQATYDPDDGQQPGFYGWCGLAEDQSDYVLGPYDSAKECLKAYRRRNPDHTPVKVVTLYRDKAPEFEVVAKLKRVK
jgi:hypothetical protein